MGQGNSTSSVNVKNNISKRIKARVDCSRSFTKMIRANVNRSLNVPKGSLVVGRDYSCEYEVFHIVPTADSFTVINPKETKEFVPDGNREEYAFLTIWIENDDESWSVYCENHPILKYSDISVNLRDSRDLSLSVNHRCGAYINPYKAGKINVVNISKMKIWVRLDADDIQKVGESSNRSGQVNVGDIGYSESSNYATEKLVYYRAKQGEGYTLVNKGDQVSFYVNNPKNRIYVSIDYETSSGEIEKHCFAHPFEYRTDNTERYPDIIVGDFKFDIQRYPVHRVTVKEIVNRNPWLLDWSDQA